MTAAYTSAYVFSRLADQQRYLVGQLTCTPPIGTFRYAPEWLLHPSAYPLDPVNLPLTPDSLQVHNPKGIFGVFSDAGPDDWGTRILLMQHKHTPQNELERLLRTSGNGIGTLEFSLSRSRPRNPEPLPDIALLDTLAAVAQSIDNRQVLTPEQLALIAPGSSLGGARPKVAVDDGKRSWLIKFPRGTDMVDIPKLEYASLNLLRDAGVRVPNTQLRPLRQNQSALMVERFDRCQPAPIHFISAHSLFHVSHLRLIRDARKNPYSYIALARILRQHAHAAERECEELFRRMVLNILLGNTDDHARNHGLIYDTQARAWQLSPAYDVLPTLSGIGGQQQALGVGLSGNDSTLDNALSCASQFMLSEKNARSQIQQLRDLVATLPERLRVLDMPEVDIALVGRHLNL